MIRCANCGCQNMKGAKECVNCRCMLFPGGISFHPASMNKDHKFSLTIVGLVFFISGLFLSYISFKDSNIDFSKLDIWLILDLIFSIGSGLMMYAIAFFIRFCVKHAKSPEDDLNKYNNNNNNKL